MTIDQKSEIDYWNIGFDWIFFRVFRMQYWDKEGSSNNFWSRLILSEMDLLIVFKKRKN